jgi:hypothetical protein
MDQMNEAIKKLLDAQQERRPDSSRAQDPVMEDAPLVKLPKPMKIEYPKFKREDPSFWVCKANQFFNYYNTPSHQKILTASFHMEEKALVWFQDAEESRIFTSWDALWGHCKSSLGSTAKWWPYEESHKAKTNLNCCCL